MTDVITPLIRDLVASLAPAPRPYQQVIEAWRTSCPRLTVWEDALDGGFVALTRDARGGLQVVATPRGRALLDEKPLDAQKPPAL
ncbi:hypothetical protein [Belnapia rosea]|uniref:hypothetical protein n=1 Tax=Belnapia rosea TaxID=938405 RepID=UPI00088598BE|nr:hypothetical protein [Belnapia rosea]SDB64360.1 hypothetical protein SAMN02927895_02735 [Belnapia rosea]